MSTSSSSRGEYWFSLLTAGAEQRQGQCASIRVADAELEGQPVRFIAVVPDAKTITRAPHAVK